VILPDDRRAEARTARTLRARTLQARRDRGQGTVVVVGVLGAVVALTFGALDVVRAVTTAHLARSAADLAALAAAGVAVRGGSASAACAEAARLAAANEGALTACSVAGDGSALVSVSVTSSGPWPRTARSSSRAGPG